MACTVLARRYRSQDFDSVVGQEAVARTLRNAIETDRVAHAYLFCGTRGVGKTSMATPGLRARDQPFRRIDRILSLCARIVRIRPSDCGVIVPAGVMIDHSVSSSIACSPRSPSFIRAIPCG